MSLDCKFKSLIIGFAVNLGGKHVLRAALGIFAFVVIEGMRGRNLRHCQRAVAHHADRQLSTWDELLH